VPAPDPSCLLAYGPAPGVELIPYFLSLLAWMGLAFLAVLLRPIVALARWLRGAPPIEPKSAAMNVPADAAGNLPAPQSGEASESGA
jgi:hypothetical protein